MGQTQVEIREEQWLINGRPTYEGRRYGDRSIEGLLLNSRMVQAIFDDANPITRPLWAYPDTGRWDPERNLREFLDAMPTWRSHGLLGITVNLQGGSPLGYYREQALRDRLAELDIEREDSEVWAGLPSPRSQPWENSGFTPGGELKPDYLSRLRRVLDRADELGMVVILGLFYQGQDERLEDESAVKNAVDAACRWVLRGGYGNVLIEINNECSVPSYDHAILKPDRVAELIEQAKAIRDDGQRLLVSTSYGGGRVPDDDVVQAADFVLMHGNGVTEPSRIAAMVEEARALASYRPMPLLFNEDDHFDFDRDDNNFLAAISSYASWGYFDPGAGAGGSSAFGNYADGYQNPPVDWTINTPRKRAFFELLSRITGSETA